jgi:hypothetical protein
MGLHKLLCVAINLLLAEYSLEKIDIVSDKVKQASKISKDDSKILEGFYNKSVTAALLSF